MIKKRKTIRLPITKTEKQSLTVYMKVSDRRRLDRLADENNCSLGDAVVGLMDIVDAQE